jgi:hypothetical protein
VLTRLNAIAGVQSSSALLADDGNRMVQIRIQPGAKAAKVVEEVQRALRAEVPSAAPVQLQGKSAGEFRAQQDWLTINQLTALAAMEDRSPQGFDLDYLLLALIVLIALCAFFFWLLRRRRNARQRSEVRLA